MVMENYMISYRNTGGDKTRYLECIQNVADEIKTLREQQETAKAKLDKSDEVNYWYPTFYKYPNVISLKDGGNYIIHEEPLKDEETVLEISKNNIEEIKAVFTKFGIANYFIEELESKNNLGEINYNDYFLFKGKKSEIA